MVLLTVLLLSAAFVLLVAGLLDVASGPVAERRMQVARNLHERVFAWMMLADERNLAAAYVAGVPRFVR